MDEYIAETESGNRKKLRIGKIFQACVKDPTRRDLVASKKKRVRSLVNWRRHGLVL